MGASIPTRHPGHRLLQGSARPRHPQRRHHAGRRADRMAHTDSRVHISGGWRWSPSRAARSAHGRPRPDADGNSTACTSGPMPDGGLPRCGRCASRLDRTQQRQESTLGAKKEAKKEGAPHRRRPPVASSGGDRVSRASWRRVFWWRRGGLRSRQRGDPGGRVTLRLTYECPLSSI
jgi:hypothetical protein